MKFLALSLLVAYAICANAYSISRGSTYGPSIPISEMVRKQGYPFEEHEITTPDGYVIVIHRIPHGRQQQQGGIRRKPVFLQHGLLSSSDSWLLNQPEISLPYLLADAGFDVWLGNVRGNTYGRRHTTMNPEQPEFWDFTFDEIARQDLPSMINYILKTTQVPVSTIGGGLRDTDVLESVLSGQNVGTMGGRTGGRSIVNPLGKLHYIGHSEGSLLGFIQFGRDKDLASKISVFVALSPIGTMGTTQTPITNLLRNVDVSNIFTGPEVFSNRQIQNVLKNYLCQTPEFQQICQNVFTSTPNVQYGNQMIPFLLSRFPAGTSSKNLMHYAQLAKTGKLQGFDYGSPQRNQFFYKQNVPTQYSLKNVDVPVVLFYGNQDWLVGDKDIQTLVQTLPNVVLQELVDTFGHLDFIMSRNAKDRVYNKLINLLLTQQI